MKQYFTIVLFCLISTFSNGKYINQDDSVFIELNLRDKNKESYLCGPVSIINWLVDNKLLSDESGINYIYSTGLNLKQASNIDIKNGLTISELSEFLVKTIDDFNLLVKPVEHDFSSFNFEEDHIKRNLLNILSENSPHFFLIKFAASKKKSISFDYENPDLESSFHYVYKKGINTDGSINIVDPMMPNIHISLKIIQTSEGIVLKGVSNNVFKYVKIKNFEAQLKNIVTLEK